MRFPSFLSSCSLLFLIYASFLSACNTGSSGPQEPSKQADVTVKPPVTLVFNTNAEAVMKDFSTWWTYHYQQVNLSEDFIGLSTDSTELQKENFLRQLTTGKYVPIRLGVQGGVSTYQLHAVAAGKDEIAAAMKADAERVLANYHLEGKPMPSFDFVDLQGNRYDAKNMTGKILVLKLWFIHCVACVQEFPELNKLVEDFKDRPDVVFVSLAMDTKPALQKFLDNREFKYAVVADQKSFIVNDLQATEFPTHIIVDKHGMIRKVVTKCTEMVRALKRISSES